ncbi:hypothetical protein D3C87_942780 [compost metagenome]
MVQFPEVPALGQEAVFVLHVEEEVAGLRDSRPARREPAPIPGLTVDPLHSPDEGSDLVVLVAVLAEVPERPAGIGEVVDGPAPALLLRALEEGEEVLGLGGMTGLQQGQRDDRAVAGPDEAVRRVEVGRGRDDGSVSRRMLLEADERAAVNGLCRLGHGRLLAAVQPGLPMGRVLLAHAVPAQVEGLAGLREGSALVLGDADGEGDLLTLAGGESRDRDAQRPVHPGNARSGLGIPLQRPVFRIQARVLGRSDREVGHADLPAGRFAVGLEGHGDSLVALDQGGRGRVEAEAIAPRQVV